MGKTICHSLTISSLFPHCNCSNHHPALSAEHHHPTTISVISYHAPKEVFNNQVAWFVSMQGQKLGRKAGGIELGQEWKLLVVVIMGWCRRGTGIGCQIM